MSATDLARTLLDGLLAAGVRQVVLAPGSRNAPLSLALVDAAGQGAIVLHSRIDERTGAFLALGLSRTVRGPVVVVTTSGTAAANLHPAVLEAAHSGIRLVVITADRPAGLRGTVANQVTEQVGLFGSAAATLDVDGPGDVAEGCRRVAQARGPVHLNVQFTEPLVPSDRYSPVAGPDVEPDPDDRRIGDPLTVPGGSATVVVAGDDAGPAARLLAEAGGWPLLAEPSSGARRGANALRCYRLLLESDLARRIDRVVVLGVPTLSRPVQRLLARPEVEVVARRPRGRWTDRPHPVTLEHDGPIRVEPGGAGGDWLARWQALDAEVSARLDALLEAEPGLTPHAVAAAVDAAVPPQGLLVVGASNPARDLDLMARSSPVGERRMVLANRGLAGIDGTLSTAIGAALGRPHSSRALAYVGDVTFLHDLTGLVIGPAEARPDLRIVVANDDGGSIFATLEQGDPRYADAFEKAFGTPHGADLGALCRGLGVAHTEVSDGPSLAAALAAPHRGIDVVEARIRRDDRRALDERIRALGPLSAVGGI